MSNLDKNQQGRSRRVRRSVVVVAATLATVGAGIGVLGTGAAFAQTAHRATSAVVTPATRTNEASSQDRVESMRAAQSERASSLDVRSHETMSLDRPSPDTATSASTDTALDG
jgi:hypothetical protein